MTGAAPEPAVDARELRKRFGARDAVAGISLQVAAGEIVGLVGPDGAGKTTTLRMLAGLLDPDAGSVRLVGADPFDPASSVRDHLGYMPQQYSLYGDLSVAENLAFFREMYGIDRAAFRARRDRLLAITRLGPFQGRRAQALSGGMYKKLALACALLHEPDVLLLDEPTNGVDPVSRREFWDLLHDFLAEGMAIVIATPYMDEAARCHRVALLDEGRVRELGAPEVVLRALAAAEPPPAPHAAAHGAEPAIRVTELAKRFGDFTAVRDVSFEVAAGEIFGYLGANGAGKSTTIRMLCGLLPASGGAATVAGIDVLHHPRAVRRAIGYMSQKFSLYLDLTVRENLAFFGGAYGLFGARLRRRSAEVADALDLGELEDQLTAELPGGLRQRIALACALLHEPRIVFLDEPTAGVDPEARRRFWQLIRRLAAAGTTIFVTTHYMDEAESCDRVGLMVAGQLAALDTPARLKTTFVPGRMLEVRGARRADLADLPGVLGVEPFGAALHVRVADDGTEAEALAAALAARGTPAAVAPTDVTLEDVFLAVVGGAS